jgi:hypothetical protein
MARIVDLGAARSRRRPTAAARRRPRAAHPFGMTVSVDLVGAQPPVTRLLELPSVLHLDQLHQVLQAVFGWEDSHLHRFALGDSPWDAEAGELFLCPVDVEDGDTDGVPEGDVRLDEVLAQVGDAMLYVYDYGDDWTHQLVVTAVGDAVDRPRCVGGSGAAPPEDSGGIWDWDASCAPFVLAEAQAALERGQAAQALPQELQTLLGHLAGSPELHLLTSLLEATDAAPSVVDEATAAAMTYRYAWLLERVGGGVTLTQAGWLPPAVVTEAMDALWPEERWIGKRNREDLTQPVRALRSSAQRLGLLRVAHGRLLLTKAGAALREDPVRLLDHVAQRAVGRPRDGFGRTATALLLVAVVAGKVVDRDLARIVAAAGWVSRSSGRVSDWAVRAAAGHLAEVLDTTDALSARDAPTDGGRALARVALAAWRG